ncbi:MAG: ParA family protein [Myxococcota bacterium]
MAFVNEKGGSAKTTLVANLGAYLALHRGRRVLGLDLDPQGQLGKVLGVDTHHAKRSAIDLLLDAVLDDAALDRSPSERRSSAESDLPISATRIANLDVVPSNKALGLFPLTDGGGADPTGRLLRALERSEAADDYDYILMDAPPSFGPLTLNVLRAAHEVVIPVPLTYLALDGCAELSRTIETVRSQYGNRGLQVTMVIPTFYRKTRLANEVLDRLKARFPKELAHTVVGFHVKIDEAQARGMSIFEHAGTSRAAKLMAALAEELEMRQPQHVGSAP